MPARPRPPAVAGAFYAERPEQLARELEACFLSPRGPGKLPARRRSADRRIVAAIVPHAGYTYSGPIAAYAYARIAAERPPEAVLLLGVDHHGASRGASLSARPWLTPLGPTPVNEELLGALSVLPVEVDEAAHASEHSIEVQLPFLEYVLPRPSIVALEVRFGTLAFLEEVASVVRDALRGRDVLLVASTDFSHYVAPAVAERLDHLAIDRILARDARGLYDIVRRERISMCGIAPTTVLLAALSDRPLSATLLRWGHSGEVGAADEVVGYASLLLEEPGAAAPLK